MSSKASLGSKARPCFENKQKAGGGAGSPDGVGVQSPPVMIPTEHALGKSADGAIILQFGPRYILS